MADPCGTTFEIEPCEMQAGREFGFYAQDFLAIGYLLP